MNKSARELWKNILIQNLKDEINKIIDLPAEDYTDGEIIDMIAKLTNYECRNEC